MNFRTQMDITTIRRSLFTLTTLILSVGVHAQKDRTKEGYALNWDKPIVVVADSISNGTHRLPAWTVSIFETDANTVLDLWRTDMKAISLGVSGKKPLKASGVTIADLGSGLMVMAQASTDKKAKLVKFTMAFATNDSTPLATNAGQEAYMRALAVKYDRAVVQKQIDVYEKMLAKATSKHSGAQADVAKSRKNITKSNEKLTKVKSKRSKLQGSIAREQGNIAGLEKKFALSNDPKDLGKLTKARKKLASSESSLAKLMKQEASVQSDISKYQGQLEKNSGSVESRSATVDELQRTLDALKRKHDTIQ